MENIEIHREGELYCLNDMAEKLINSKNVKEFVKKIEGKTLINSNYYITYDSMINLLSKSKSATAKQYLLYLNSIKPKKKKEIIIDDNVTIKDDNIKTIKNKHITTKEELIKKSTERNFVDFGTNNILYDDKKILFFEFEENIYFKGKDICDLLKYEDHKKAFNQHIDKEDIFKFSEIEGNTNNKNEYTVGGEGGVKHLPYSPKQISQLEKIKLNLEKKLTKVIDNNTIFINESGLYSLIFSSKLPKAKEFKKWVTHDILISIRKTGSYNKNQNQIYYDDNKIKELNNENCVYIIRVKDSLYKFGITSHLKIRMYNHKRFLDYDEILEVFTLPNLNIALNIETKIKHYAINCKIRKIIENVGTELFETNDDYSIERIIKEIKIMVEEELDNQERRENKYKFDSILLLENTKIKQFELELKKYEILESMKNSDLLIEIEKTKQLQMQEKNKQIKLETIKVQNTQTNLILEKTNKCIDCEALIAHTSKRCITCENKNRFSKAILESKRPSLKQLTKDLKKLGSYVQVGIKYNVSDNCIRKWIRKYQNLT
jgi:prophage antirepressor-like protein/predicted GIY-YIG superfamily endonuclease